MEGLKPQLAVLLLLSIIFTFQAVDSMDNPLVKDVSNDSSLPVDDILCPDICNCTQESSKFTADCSSNGLEHLPVVDKFDPRTNIMLLNGNQLKNLDSTITALKELDELNLEDNSLDNISNGSISKLPKLQRLILANNNLSAFPKDLKLASTLTTLDLSGNYFYRDLRADDFSLLNNIKSIVVPNETGENQDIIIELCKHHTTLEHVCIDSCYNNVINCTKLEEDRVTSEELTISNSSNTEVEETHEDTHTKDTPEPDTFTEISNTDKVSFVKPEDASTDNTPAEDVVTTTDNVSSATPEYSSTHNTLAEDEVTTTDNVSSATPEYSSTHNRLAEDEVTTTDNVSFAAPEDSSTHNTEDEVTTQPSTIDDNQAEKSPAHNDTTKLKAPSHHPDKNGDERQLPLPTKIEDPETATTNVHEKKLTKFKFVESENRSESDITTKDTMVHAATSKEDIVNKGGDDNMTIALVSACIVCLVAGVVITKNWSTIREKIKRRGTVPDAAANTTGNRMIPDNVPLQEISPV